jgi:hypothetical protein
MREVEVMEVFCFGVAPEFRRRNPFDSALFHSLLRIGSSGTGGLNVDGSAAPHPAGWSCALKQTWALNSSRIFRNVRLMSALGQKQTLRRILVMSALPPKADIGGAHRDVRLVPIADIVQFDLCRAGGVQDPSLLALIIG